MAGIDRMARLLIGCCVGYGAVLLLLRLMGARQLSDLRDGDFAFLIAASVVILATAMPASDVGYAEGVMALTLLAAAHVVLRRPTRPRDRLDRLLNEEPMLVCFRGCLLRQAMHRGGVSDETVRRAVRARGQSDLRAVHAVVLEPDGALTVELRSPTNA